MKKVLPLNLGAGSPAGPVRPAPKPGLQSPRRREHGTGRTTEGDGLARPGPSSAESSPFSPATALLQVGGTQAPSASVAQLGSERREAGQADGSLHGQTERRRGAQGRAQGQRSSSSSRCRRGGGGGGEWTACADRAPPPTRLAPAPAPHKPRPLAPPLDALSGKCESLSRYQAKARTPRGRRWGKSGADTKKSRSRGGRRPRTLEGPQPRATSVAVHTDAARAH